MTILVDFNGVAIAGLIAEGSAYTDDLNTDLARHFVLNSLQSTRNKFHRQYGELVICCDGPNSWRKRSYPYYKAKRKAAKEMSPINWSGLFTAMDTIRTELKTVFPYKVIQIEGCEADDVIAVLAKHEWNQFPAEECLVISNDKDLVQCARWNCDVYSPIKARKFASPTNVTQHVKEHIIRGDPGDGIPNVLSDDDTFVNPDKRQTPLRQNKLASLLDDPIESYNEETLRNYKRNELLIDLSMIPSDLEQKILEAHEVEVPAMRRSALLSFFISKGLRNLVDKISNF